MLMKKKAKASVAVLGKKRERRKKNEQAGS